MKAWSLQYFLSASLVNSKEDKERIENIAAWNTFQFNLGIGGDVWNLPLAGITTTARSATVSMLSWITMQSKSKVQSIGYERLELSCYLSIEENYCPDLTHIVPLISAKFALCTKSLNSWRL